MEQNKQVSRQEYKQAARPGSRHIKIARQQALAPKASAATEETLNPKKPSAKARWPY